MSAKVVNWEAFYKWAMENFLTPRSIVDKLEELSTLREQVRIAREALEKYATSSNYVLVNEDDAVTMDRRILLKIKRGEVELMAEYVAKNAISAMERVK